MSINNDKVSKESRVDDKSLEQITGGTFLFSEKIELDQKDFEIITKAHPGNNGFGGSLSDVPRA